MAAIETDYLIIGSGAVGMAFADTLIDECDADVVIVDRHGKPGGHWNDAYSFVALHQPSAFYGVNSMPLGNNRKDSIGANQGLFELASGPEVSGYFDNVMRQKLLPSGRVRYFSMADYTGSGRFTSLLSGEETTVSVRRKTVDATYYGTSVPATHRPRYAVAEDVRLITPNALPQLWIDQTIRQSGKGSDARPHHFVIVGAGKTAMDTGVWLLSSGASPQSISWVVPRDSWLLNRLRTQPGLEFFHETIGGQADLMEAFANAQSVDDLFLKLEAADIMLRIDPKVKPGMFHYATMSKGEVAVLQRITNIIRLGRVQSIDSTGLTLDDGHVPMGEGTLYIDCTASAVEPRPAMPIFNGSLITPQLVRAPQPAFSAALVAFVEAHYPDDDTKNKLCRTVPFPHTIDQYPACNLVNMMNQMAWSQDPLLSKWLLRSRLDGFGKVIAAIDKNDAEKMAVLSRLRGNAMAAAGNLQKLSGLG